MKKLLMTVVLGAVLFGATSARAANIKVKVECWGYACMNVTLNDVCYRYGYQYVPLDVSCAQPANIVSGDDVFTCPTYGTATCARRTFNPSDYLGDYCNDTNGYDAIVTCQGT